MKKEPSKSFPYFSIFALILLVFSFPAQSQNCLSRIILKLKNIKGGIYSGEHVMLTSSIDGATFQQVSDTGGKVSFLLPCDVSYEVSISNYSKTIKVKSPPEGELIKTLGYEPDMIQKEKFFVMSEEEKNRVDIEANKLKDTTFITGSKMTMAHNLECYVTLNLTIVDFGGNPLAYEWIVYKGIKRKKCFKGKTDMNGNLLVFLPKGDIYTLSFKYHSNYSSSEYPYSKGSDKVDTKISYLGTKEIERRKNEEATRIAALEKELKEQRERFERRCKKLGITLEEGYRRELDSLRKNDHNYDTAIIATLNRNKWPEKLIVCDLTGSMQPYSVELSVWYQLNYKREKNLQFVFFNDGDNKPDDKKKIGETGGIYYAPSKGIDSLNRLIYLVTAAGSGGDCPENNMEALIKGTELAKPFKEIVMIVDNYAPVKDIVLLKDFKQPVHIILCGAVGNDILPDYLLIAWKTKGTIHTIEEDITSIAKMSEGEEIKIGGVTYRIMGGEFVRINKT